MKRIVNKLVVLVIGLLVLNSCYDLDQYPFDSVNSGTFWKTDSHAKEGLMGVYAQLKEDGTFGRYFVFDCLTDIGWGYGQAFESIELGNYDYRTSYVTEHWRDNYQGIMLANNAIANIQKSETISAEVKKNTLGEAKFLRALFYFNLLNLYGGVPIYDENFNVPKNFNDMKEPRSTEDQVRDFIVKDLTDAYGKLPVNWGKNNLGRATKWAALSLRGKVFLYAKKYDKARDDFREVVASRSFSLYPQYDELFTRKADNSNEIIFAVQNSGGVGMNYGMPFAWILGTRSTYGFCWNNSMPTVELFSMYETKSGKRFDWNDYFPNFTSDDQVKRNVFYAELSKNQKNVLKYPIYEQKLLDMYEDRDPRMKQTIILPYTTYFARTKKNCEYVINKGALTQNGFVQPNKYSYVYLWRKFVPTGEADGTQASRNHTPINFPIIRYADVLLMLAECENELGNQSEAVVNINKVRGRSSTNMPKINSGPGWLSADSKKEVFDRIVNERAVELAGEGLRFFDLKRWGMYKDKVNGFKVYSIFEEGNIVKPYLTKVVTNRDYLWPIPGNQQDVHELEQNPGW